MDMLFADARVIQIEQHARSWWEILIGLEQRNQYAITVNGRHGGFAVEQGTSFLDRIVRIVLGSHRPLHLIVFTGNDQVTMNAKRPFYWIFSTMTVADGNGRSIGVVQKRWGIVTKKYDLVEGGRSFAKISAGLFKIWTFPVYDLAGKQIATISKKWGGLLKEYITDADRFGISFESTRLTTAQKAVVFAAALSIDFDYFENNQSR
jgi:hypothetical protein